MTYQIAISNRVNEKLRELKGQRSYTSIIEELLRKSGIVILNDVPMKPSITTSSNPDKGATTHD